MDDYDRAKECMQGLQILLDCGEAMDIIEHGIKNHGNIF